MTPSDCTSDHLSYTPKEGCDRGSPRVAILLFPFASLSIGAFAAKLTRVLSSLTSRVVLVTGGVRAARTWPSNVQVRDTGLRLHYLKDRQPQWFSALLWVVRMLWVQIRMAWQVFDLRHGVDVVFFTLGHYYQLPILAARLCRKKVVGGSFGNSTLLTKVSYGSRLLTAAVSILARFNFALSDAILVESFHVARDNNDLCRYQSKLRHGALFIENLDHFSIHPAVSQEGNLVGFIGRLSAEKGIREFLQAIPLALQRQPDLRFLIIGRGLLDGEVREAIRGRPWESRVTLVDWVDHAEIPLYLNRLSLLVMPSYTEGLPNVALEAMACGTPLLATAVGGLPDLVRHGETGFVLEEVSPAGLADAIVEALNDTRLDQIVRKARALIEQDYCLEASRRRFSALIESLSVG